MADFNYSNYSDSLVSNGSYRFAPEDANRDEYRYGLDKTAKGLISTFDVDGDGQMSEDEFIHKEKLENDEQTAIFEQEKPNLTSEQIKKFEKELKYDEARTKGQFNAMDVNGDGKLDNKEIANALLLADANDSEDLETDGTLGVDGLAKIFSPKKTPEKLKEALRQNYTDQNMAKLGESGDIDKSKVRKNFDKVVTAENQASFEQEVSQEIIQDAIVNYLNSANSSQNLTGNNIGTVNKLQNIVNTLINVILQLFGLSASINAQREVPKVVQGFYC